MIQGLYSIKDSVANEYGPVITAKNDGTAVRHILDIFQGQHITGALLLDYSFHKLAEFDNETGEIVLFNEEIDFMEEHSRQQEYKKNMEKDQLRLSFEAAQGVKK